MKNHPLQEAYVYDTTIGRLPEKVTANTDPKNKIRFPKDWEIEPEHLIIGFAQGTTQYRDVMELESKTGKELAFDWVNRVMEEAVATQNKEMESLVQKAYSFLRDADKNPTAAFQAGYHLAWAEAFRLRDNIKRGYLQKPSRLGRKSKKRVHPLQNPLIKTFKIWEKQFLGKRILSFKAMDEFLAWMSLDEDEAGHGLQAIADIDKEGVERWTISREFDNKKVGGRTVWNWINEKSSK